MDVFSHLDMKGVSRLMNLPNATTAQEPATKAQLDAAVEGLAWKDSARVATQANTNLSSPGATIDGVTMVSNDRVLVRSQTTASQNGIYIWNGSAVAMTRAPDASTADELENATLSVDEGSSAGASFRQSAVNFTLDSGAVSFGPFGGSTPPASESTAGAIEIATQAETDAGTDDVRAVTPLKLKSSSYVVKRAAGDIGDGSALQYDVTHGMNTQDVLVSIFRKSDGVEVIADVTRTSVNVVRINFASAPAANAYRVVIRS